MKRTNNAYSLNRNILDFHDSTMNVAVYWSRVALASHESLLTKDASHTFFEVHCILNGCVEMCFENGRKVSLQKNELMIVPPGCFHKITHFEPNTEKFVLGFSLESEQPEVLKAIEAISLLNVIRIGVEIETPIHLLRKISLKNGALVYEQLRSLLRFLILALFTAEIEYAGLQNPEWFTQNRKYDVKISSGEMIMAYIKSHPVGLTVQEIANHFFFSTRHVNRVLTESFGKTTLQLLQQEKILYIKKLLTTTDLTETDIAEMCHFSNSSSMNRFFRKFEKCPVSEFKKNINK